MKVTHDNNLSNPQLQIWACMISNDFHNDIEDKPNVPFFGSTINLQRSVTNAITVSAVVITKILGGTLQEIGSSGYHTNITPVKVIELCTKDYEQKC